MFIGMDVKSDVTSYDIKVLSGRSSMQSMFARKLVVLLGYTLRWLVGGGVL